MLARLRGNDQGGVECSYVELREAGDAILAFLWRSALRRSLMIKRRSSCLLVITNPSHQLSEDWWAPSQHMAYKSKKKGNKRWKMKRMGDRKRNRPVIQRGFLFSSWNGRKAPEDFCLFRRSSLALPHKGESSTDSGDRVGEVVSNKRGMKDGTIAGSVPETSASHKSSTVSLGADG